MSLTLGCTPYIGRWDEPRALDQTNLMDEDPCSSKAVIAQSTRLLLIGQEGRAAAPSRRPPPDSPRVLLCSGGFLTLLDPYFVYIA